MDGGVDGIRRSVPVWVFVSAAWLGPAILAAFQAYVQARLGNPFDHVRGRD